MAQPHSLRPSISFGDSLRPAERPSVDTYGSSRLEAGLPRQTHSRNPSENQNLSVDWKPDNSKEVKEKPYSEWTGWEKKLIIFFASGAAIFSPLSE